MPKSYHPDSLETSTISWMQLKKVNSPRTLLRYWDITRIGVPFLKKIRFKNQQTTFCNNPICTQNLWGEIAINIKCKIYGMIHSSAKQLLESKLRTAINGTMPFNIQSLSPNAWIASNMIWILIWMVIENHNLRHKAYIFLQISVS